VADGAAITHDCVSGIAAVKHGTVLDRGLFADHDPAVVAT